ncbi:MAG: methylmalonyl-CoA mutase family protein, partial [Isosphaeraceae bacterium]
FQERDETPLGLLVVDEAVEREQMAALRRVKERRNQADVRRVLDEVRRTALGRTNLMPTLLDAARARVTVGEVMTALADVFGRDKGAAIW